MSIALRLVVVLFCAILLLFVFRLVAREKLMLKYSLLWLFLVVAVMLCAIYPNGIFAIAKIFGFANPSNFIFFLGLFCLLAISLSLSVIVSKQTMRIKNLTQRLALLEHSISHHNTNIE